MKPKNKTEGQPRHSSIRLALKNNAVRGVTHVEHLTGGFSLDGNRMSIGGDTYELVKVDGEGDCAFDSMMYILHHTLNREQWRGARHAYEKTGWGSADEMRKAFDAYRSVVREGTWGDEIDWLLFCAMFGVTVNIISYIVLDEGPPVAMNSVIWPYSWGAKVYIPGFVNVDKRSVDAGLAGFVCNHDNKHYDPMELVCRCG